MIVFYAASYDSMKLSLHLAPRDNKRAKVLCQDVDNSFCFLQCLLAVLKEACI